MLMGKKKSCENQIFHILCQQFSFLPLHPSVSSVFCFSFATNVILMFQSNYCAKKNITTYIHIPEEDPMSRIKSIYNFSFSLHVTK